jgi:hypothetical protein
VRGLHLFGARGLARPDAVARRRALRIDRRTQPCEIRRIEQPADRHLHEIRIADILVAIRVGAAHRFGEVVDGSRRAMAVLLVAGAVENPEHLEQGDAAGA